MKIEDAVQCMSKSYLHRILDSYTKDIHKPDEDESRRRLIRDSEDLASPDSIRQRFGLSSIPFSEKTLIGFIVEILLEQPEYSLSETELIKNVFEREKSVLEDAKSGSSLKYRDPATIKIYKTVLEVALKDSQITEDEKRLLKRLRNHLGLKIRDHYVLQAQLQRFPNPGNELHTAKEINSVIKSLQKRGVVFYLNKADGEAQIVIPDEIVPGLKAVLGIELGESAYRLLLDHLSKKQLKHILDENDWPVSGAKDQQINKIVESGLEPSRALDYLQNSELYELCKSLPGVKVSGLKQARIENVIQYFDRLKTREAQKSEDPRARLYEFYNELATRDRQNLMGNKVIKKDIDIDRYFEDATRFLFEEKCGLTHESTRGTEHADGVFQLSSNEYLMWDTKSKEQKYRFPNDHLRQFKRYIRDADQRVACFLIIAPEIDESAMANAYKLKLESGRDTDVALISASDLKWLAENWKKHISKCENLRLDVFNVTGVLTRHLLEQRLRLFA